MKASSVCAFVLVVCTILSCVNAHMYLANVVINGKQENCIRPHPERQYDYPLSDKTNKVFDTTDNMICGWPPALSTAAPSVCPVPAGSTIGLQWWHAAPGDDVVDGSHKGPCIVYMSKATGNVGTDGRGAVWFKIYEEGLNGGEFCTDRIRKEGAKKGILDVTIPSDLAPGRYLLRGEVIALHEGYDNYGAQFYVGCAEITVTGGGSADPSNKVAIPSGLYKPTDAGILFNVYQGKTTYPIPGPQLYISGGAPNPNPNPTSAPNPSGTTPAPGSCSVGSLGCSCSGGTFCNNGLKCNNNICVFVECSVGSESCPCTAGGACDPGLDCLSKVCVNTQPFRASFIVGNSAGKVFNPIVMVVTVALAVFALF